MGSLEELRILEGPSPDLPLAAVRLTLRLPTAISPADAEELLKDIAAHADHPVGEVTSRVVNDELTVIAYPWQDRAQAEELGEQFAAALDSIAAGTDRASAVQAAAGQVSQVSDGVTPRAVNPHIPAIAVSGTNGKTTTTRMIAHLARTAGKSVGWSSTDGVFVDGVCIDEGDWSGPGGAQMVLEQPVDVAVLETARGGLMTRGMGVTAVDATVVTNVTDDHLGLHHINTLEQLAWAKATPTKVVRPEGWAILNAEDPLVLAMAEQARGRVWLSSVNPNDHTSAAARATTVINGRVVVLENGQPIIDLGDIVDMPITLAGLSRENIANLLGAASAALAIGLSPDDVRHGLATFAPDLTLNPGRMNIFSLRDATIICDFAHNEAGAAALIRVAQGLTPGDGRLIFSIGNAGDRTDDNIRGVGRMTGEIADIVVLAAKDAYLRGRTQEDIDRLQREGLAEVGKHDVEEFPDEMSCMQALVTRLQPRDVVAFMVHQQRDELYDFLFSLGATLDGPDDIKAKALAIRDAART